MYYSIQINKDTQKIRTARFEHCIEGTRKEAPDQGEARGVVRKDCWSLNVKLPQRGITMMRKYDEAFAWREIVLSGHRIRRSAPGRYCDAIKV